MLKKIFKDKNWIILFSILIFGALIRILGANWGLPTPLHPDEGTIVDTAIRMTERHSFEPDVFFRPDHLEIKLNMLVYSFISFIFYGISVGELSQIHKEIFFLTARIITAFFGTGMIFMSYLIGAKIKKEIGLISAFLFAFFPDFIVHSHYTTPDIPTGFFMLLCIYFCINYLQKPTCKNLAFICMSVSAFTAIKYPGAILCIFIAIVVIMSSIKDKDYKRIFSHGILAIILVICFLFLISPVLFTNFQAVHKAFINEARTTHLGADGLGFSGNLFYYFTTYVTSSGLILFFFFLCGVFIFIKKNLTFELIPIFFSFIYYICLSYVPLHWERWAVPMYISPLLLSAIGLYYVYQFLNKQLKQKKQIKYLLKIFYASVVIVIFNFSLGSLGKLIDFIVTDTRTISQAYCIENNINTNNTNFEGYTPLLPTDPKNLSPFKQINGKYYLSENKIKNIVISSNMYSRYKAEPEKYKDQIAMYNGIAQQYTLVKKYVPAELEETPIEVINIIHNIQYVYNVKKSNYAGPELEFYKARKQNYKP